MSFRNGLKSILLSDFWFKGIGGFAWFVRNHVEPYCTPSYFKTWHCIGWNNWVGNTPLTFSTRSTTKRIHKTRSSYAPNMDAIRATTMDVPSSVSLQIIVCNCNYCWKIFWTSNHILFPNQRVNGDSHTGYDCIIILTFPQRGCNLCWNAKD